MPSSEVLRAVAKKAFMSADIDNNGYLTLDEVELWCNNNLEFKAFLDKFGTYLSTMIYLFNIESPKVIAYDQETFEDFLKVDFRFLIEDTLDTQNDLEVLMKGMLTI